MRDKLLGAEFIMPLAADDDSYTEHKDAILADIVEDELDGIGEWEMKSRLADYIREDYGRYEDDILDDMWLYLAKEKGLELKWTEKDTEENVRKMVKSAEEHNNGAI